MPKSRFKHSHYVQNQTIKNEFNMETSNDITKITIYGDIGESWWDDDAISSSKIEDKLKEVNTSDIHLHINSLGGDVFDGIAIYNLFKNHSAKITVYVDGIAASAASLIAMSGDEIVMNTGSMLMIHEASTWSFGSKTEIQKTFNALQSIDSSIAEIYMTKFNGEKSDVDLLIKAETWFTAAEAIEAGFADRMNTEDEQVYVSEDELEDDAGEDEGPDEEVGFMARFKSRAMMEKNKNNILNKFKRVSNK